MELRNLVVASVLALSLAALMPNHARGQTVHGRVTDANSGEPIPGATVRLHRAGAGAEEVVGSVLTDRNGIFRMQAENGSYTLSAERIGYGKSRSEEFEIHDDLIAEVIVRLAIDPVALEPIEIVSEREPSLQGVLIANGFYERRRDYGGRGLPFAQFLTRDELQIEYSQYLTDVFNWVPAVRITDGSGHHAEIELMTRCKPTFYLDGVPIGRGGGLTINEVIDPSRIAGVEIYPGTRGPREFRDVQFMVPPCGTIVIWSTRAQSRDHPDGDPSERMPGNGWVHRSLRCLNCTATDAQGR